MEKTTLDQIWKCPEKIYFDSQQHANAVLFHNPSSFKLWRTTTEQSLPTFRAFFHMENSTTTYKQLQYFWFPKEVVVNKLECAVYLIKPVFENVNSLIRLQIHCPPLNRITLSQHKSDNNNRMIQLTDVFCVLLRYKRVSNFWLQ